MMQPAASAASLIGEEVVGHHRERARGNPLFFVEFARAGGRVERSLTP
jgi:hypothetical protein